MLKRHPDNERIKHRYFEFLKQADGKSEQTIRQIEKAILRFEEFTGFADLKSFDQKRAIDFKSALAKENLAPATILSTVHALKRFLGWLALQPGYKSRIRVNDIEYLNLSEKDTPNPQRLIEEQVRDDYIVLTQRPTYAAEAAWKNEVERPDYIETNKLRFLRPYQLKAIHALQRAVKDGKDRFLFEMATGTGKTLCTTIR